jgi:mannitol-1-phosphate/altronate dehydrogenase
MELSSYLIWNAFITLVLAPVLYSIRENAKEAKRLDVLLNKTREEIARDYVSKRELEQDLGRILNAIQKLDEKLDRIQEAAVKEYRL